MKRITFRYPEDNPFPPDNESAYIKFLIPEEGESQPDAASILSMLPVGKKPTMRTFTIRKQRSEIREIDVDFVIHGDSGPASSWAINTKPGDSINIVGPGPTKRLDNTADWFLIVGDMTALPALSVNIEGMEDTARGHVIIEILNEEDKQSLPFPEQIDVHWMVNPDPQQSRSLLLDKLSSIEWYEGRPFVWIAGESKSVKVLRDYLNENNLVDKKDRYISGYWQLGPNEMEHKKVKTTDK
jgi:NADPH-dependent ferric siderophore reductase